MILVHYDSSVKRRVYLIINISLYQYCCYVCSFDDFLMDMKQSKRKNIRQERKKVGIHKKKKY